MGFFYEATKKRLPLRGRNKLPLRSRRSKRLQLLKDFQPGRVYSFVPIYELDDLPEDTTLWADDDWSDEVTRHDC